MDSIVPATALTVTSLVNNLLSSARTAKDLAKQSSDSDLKERIAEVFNDILDLKAKVLDLDSENRDLREQLKQRTLVERDPTTEGFYKKGETDPLCPKCLQSAGNYTYLQRSNDGTGWCVVCTKSFRFARRAGRVAQT
jgi:hypothetical protein